MDDAVLRAKKTLQVIGKPENECAAKYVNIIIARLENLRARHLLKQLLHAGKGTLRGLPAWQRIDVMKARGAVLAADVVWPDCVLYK